MTAPAAGIVMPVTEEQVDEAPMRRRAAALARALDDLTLCSDAELGQLFMGHGYTLDSPPGRTAARAPETLIDRLPQLFAKYAAGAALITSQWYRELEPTSDYDPQPFVDLGADQVLETARWAFFAPGEESALSRMAGSGQRMIYDASRDTVVRNAAAEDVRWYRYAQPDACAFCSVLATRTMSGPGGPRWTYKTGEWTGGAPGWGQGPTATRVGYSEHGIRGPRKMGEQYHDRCRCQAVPVRGPAWLAPPSYVADFEDQYLEAYAGISKGDALAKELGIDGETPNINNVSMYIRHARGRESGQAATEPRARVAQERRKQERAKAAGKPVEPEPAWKSMPRTNRDEIAKQFTARTGIEVRPDRRTSNTTAFGVQDDPEMLREFLDGIADMNDKYDIAKLAQERDIHLSLGSSSRVQALAWMQGGDYPDPNDPYGGKIDIGEIMLNRGWAKKPEEFESQGFTGENTPRIWDGRWGKSGPKLVRKDGSYAETTHKSKTPNDWKYVRGTATHETGHLMDRISGWRPTFTGKAVLMETYMDTKGIDRSGIPKPVIDWNLLTRRALRDWENYEADLSNKLSGGAITLGKKTGYDDYFDWLIDSLPGYAFKAGERNQLFIQEAIAESVKTVESMGPKRSNEAQRALHDLTVRDFVEAQRDRRAAAAAAGKPAA